MLKFNSPPVIGQRVTFTQDDDPTLGSGIYVGVALDEDDRVPYHYFIDCEIGGTFQESHGFPAEEGTEVTTDFTPTELITSEISRRIKVRAQSRIDPGTGNATLVVVKSVLVGNGLDHEEREIANYTLSYLPSSSEVALISVDEIVYSTEIG